MIPKDRPIGTRLGEFQMRTRREKKKPRETVLHSLLIVPSKVDTLVKHPISHLTAAKEIP